MLKVNQKSAAVTRMHTQGEVIRALLGGTEAMRQAGKTYLPQWPQEADDAYQTRLNTSTLLPALKETLAQMVGRVFFDRIDTGGVAENLQDLLPDIDLQNNHLDIFCAAWFADALAFGASYALAEYPKSKGGIRTAADDRNEGLRPYAVHIRNADVLGWRSEIRGGQAVCTQFRYRSTVWEEDGVFGEKQAEQIHVLTPGKLEIYREIKGEWTLYEQTELTGHNGKPLDYVPVVDLVFGKTGFFSGSPPLLELAHLNVKHWQSQSDQDNIVHYVRVPLLVFNGNKDDMAGGAAAAGNVFCVGENGALSYVEHSGAAINAGETALQKLEDDMQAAGAKLLTRTKLAFTDSQARDERSREISQLRLYANLTEDAVGRLLDFLAGWRGLKDGGAVEISGNLDADPDPAVGFDAVLKMHTAGALSAETVFAEAKRRGVLAEASDWQSEKARLAVEGADDAGFEA